MSKASFKHKFMPHYDTDLDIKVSKGAMIRSGYNQVPHHTVIFSHKFLPWNLQRNFVKLTVKWSFSYNFFVKLFFYKVIPFLWTMNIA